MEYKLSSSAFNQYETVTLTNEIPHMSTYSILNKHIQMDWSRDIIGQVRTFYDDRESVKLVDGVQSPNYTSDYVKVINSNGEVVEGYIPKVNFEITGGFEKEMDYLMHEMHRYLFRSYPEHPNSLITLTKAERQSYFNEAGHMLDSFWDTENIPSNSELEDFYLKHKFLTNVTVARKYCGSSKEEDILIHLFGVSATFTEARTFVDDKQDKVVALNTGLEANTSFNKIYRYFTESKASTSFESDTFANLTNDFTSFVKDVVVAKELPSLVGTLYDFAITEDPITPIITNLNNILEYGSVNGSITKKDGSTDNAGGKRGSVSSSMVLTDVIADSIFGKYPANTVVDPDYIDQALTFDTNATLGASTMTNLVPYKGSSYSTEIVKAAANKFLTRESSFSKLKDAIVLKLGNVVYNDEFIKWFTILCKSELVKKYKEDQEFNIHYSANRRMQYNFDVQFDLVERTGKTVLSGFLNRDLLTEIPDMDEVEFNYAAPQEDLDAKDFFQCITHPRDCDYINFGNGDFFNLKISFRVWEDQRKTAEGKPIGYVSDIAGNAATSGVFNPVKLLDYVSDEKTNSGIPYLPQGALTKEGEVEFYGLNCLRQIPTLDISSFNSDILLDDNWLTSFNTIEVEIEGGFSLYQRITELSSTSVDSKTSDDGKIIYFVRSYTLRDEYTKDPYAWATAEILNSFAVNTETIIKQIGREEEVTAQALSKLVAEMVDEETIRVREDIKENVHKAGRLEFMLIDAKSQRHFGYIKDAYTKNDYCYLTIGEVYPPLNYSNRNVLKCFFYVKGDLIESREEDNEKFRRKTTVRAAAYDNKYYYETTWGALSDDNLRWYCDSFTSDKAESYIEVDKNFTTDNELYDPNTLTEYEALTLVSCDPKYIKPITDLINENKSLYIDSSIKFVSHIPLIQGTTAHSKEYNTISAMFTDTVPNYITFYDVDIKDFPEFEGFYNATLDPDLKDIHYVETIVNRSLMVWGNSIWDGTADETTKKLRTIWGGYFSNFIVKDLREYLPDSYTSLHSIGSNSSVSIKLDNYNYACNEGQPEKLWNLVYSPSGGVNSTVHMQVLDYYSDAEHLGKDWKEYRSEESAKEPEALSSILVKAGSKIPTIDVSDTYEVEMKKEISSSNFKYELETVPLDFKLNFDYEGPYQYECRGLYENQTLGVEDGVRLVTYNTTSTDIKDIVLIDKQIHYQDYWNPVMVFQVRHKPIEAYLGHMLYEYSKTHAGAISMSAFTDYLSSITYAPAIAYLEDDKLRLAIFTTIKGNEGVTITVQDFGMPISMHVVTELFGKNCTGFEFENSATMRKVIAALSNTIYNIPNSTWTGRLKETQINLAGKATALKENFANTEMIQLANEEKDPNEKLNNIAIFRRDGAEKFAFDIKKKINQSDKVTVLSSDTGLKYVKIEDLVESDPRKADPYGIYKFQENNKYFKEYTQETVTLSAANNGNEYMDCTIDFGRNEDMGFEGSDEILLYAIRAPIIRSVYAPSKEIQIVERSYEVANLNVASYEKGKLNETTGEFVEGKLGTHIYLSDSSATSIATVSRAIDDMQGIDSSNEVFLTWLKGNCIYETGKYRALNLDDFVDANTTLNAGIAKVYENIINGTSDNNKEVLKGSLPEVVKAKYDELKEEWADKVKHQEITTGVAKFGIKWPSPTKDIGYSFYKRKFITEGVVYASEPNRIYVNDASITLTEHVGGGDSIELVFIDSLSTTNPKTQIDLNVSMKDYPGPYRLLSFETKSEAFKDSDGGDGTATTLYLMVGFSRGIVLITITDKITTTLYGSQRIPDFSGGADLQTCSAFAYEGSYYCTAIYSNGTMKTYNLTNSTASGLVEDAPVLDSNLSIQKSVFAQLPIVDKTDRFKKWFEVAVDGSTPHISDFVPIHGASDNLGYLTDDFLRHIRYSTNAEGPVLQMADDPSMMEQFKVIAVPEAKDESSKSRYLDWLIQSYGKTNEQGTLVFSIPALPTNAPVTSPALGAKPPVGSSNSWSESEEARFLAELLFAKGTDGNYIANGKDAETALQYGGLLLPECTEITTGAYLNPINKDDHRQTVALLYQDPKKLANRVVSPDKSDGKLVEDPFVAEDAYGKVLDALEAATSSRLKATTATADTGTRLVAMLDTGGCFLTIWDKTDDTTKRLDLHKFLGYETTETSTYGTMITTLFKGMTEPGPKIWDDYLAAVEESQDLRRWIIQNAFVSAKDEDNNDVITWFAPYSAETSSLEDFNEEMWTDFRNHIARMKAADALAPSMLTVTDSNSPYSLKRVFDTSVSVAKSATEKGAESASKLKAYEFGIDGLRNLVYAEGQAYKTMLDARDALIPQDADRVKKLKAAKDALLAYSGEAFLSYEPADENWTSEFEACESTGINNSMEFAVDRDTMPVAITNEKVVDDDTVRGSINKFGKVNPKPTFIGEGGALKAYQDAAASYKAAVANEKAIEATMFGSDHYNELFGTNWEADTGHLNEFYQANGGHIYGTSGDEEYGQWSWHTETVVEYVTPTGVPEGVSVTPERVEREVLVYKENNYTQYFGSDGLLRQTYYGGNDTRVARERYDAGVQNIQSLAMEYKSLKEGIASSSNDLLVAKENQDRLIAGYADATYSGKSDFGWPVPSKWSQDGLYSYAENLSRYYGDKYESLVTEIEWDYDRYGSRIGTANIVTKNIYVNDILSLVDKDLSEALKFKFMTGRSDDYWNTDTGYGETTKYDNSTVNNRNASGNPWVFAMQVVADYLSIKSGKKVTVKHTPHAAPYTKEITQYWSQATNDWVNEWDLTEPITNGNYYDSRAYDYNYPETLSTYEFEWEDDATSEPILTHKWNTNYVKYVNGWYSSYHNMGIFEPHVISQEAWFEILSLNTSNAKRVQEIRTAYNKNEYSIHNTDLKQTIVVDGVKRSLTWIGTACIVKNVPFQYKTKSQLDAESKAMQNEKNVLSQRYKDVQAAVSLVFGPGKWKFVDATGLGIDLSGATEAFNGYDLKLSYNDGNTYGGYAGSLKAMEQSESDSVAAYKAKIDELIKARNTTASCLSALNTAMYDLCGYPYKITSYRNGYTLIENASGVIPVVSTTGIPNYYQASSKYGKYISAINAYQAFFNSGSNWTKALGDYRDKFVAYRTARRARKVSDRELFGVLYNSPRFDVDSNENAYTWHVDKQNGADEIMCTYQSSYNGQSYCAISTVPKNQKLYSAEGYYSLTGLDSAISTWAAGGGKIAADPAYVSGDNRIVGFTIPSYTQYGKRGVYLNSLAVLNTQWDPLPYPFPITVNSKVWRLADYYAMEGTAATVRNERVALFNSYYQSLVSSNQTNLWTARAKLKATIELSERAGEDTSGIENYLPSSQAEPTRGEVVAIADELDNTRRLLRSYSSIKSLIKDAHVLVDDANESRYVYIYGKVDYSRIATLTGGSFDNVVTAHNNISKTKCAVTADYNADGTLKDSNIKELASDGKPCAFLLRVDVDTSKIEVNYMADDGDLIESIIKDPNGSGYKVVWQSRDDETKVALDNVSDLLTINNGGALGAGLSTRTFKELEKCTNVDAFKDVDVLLLDTITDELKVELDEFTFDEDRIKTGMVANVQSRTFDEEGDSIIIRNHNVAFDNVSEARVIVMVEDPTRDNFQFPYGKATFAQQLPELVTFFEVEGSEFADFAATTNKFDFNQETMSKVDLFLPQYAFEEDGLKTTKNIYPFITDISSRVDDIDNQLSKFYKLDEDGKPMLMKNRLGRYLFRILPPGFRLPCKDLDDQGYEKQSAFSSSGYIMKRGTVSTTGYCIPSNMTAGAMFIYDATDGFKYNAGYNATTKTTVWEKVEQGGNALNPELFVSTEQLIGKSYNQLLGTTEKDFDKHTMTYAGVYEMVDNPRQAVLDNPYKVVNVALTDGKSITIEDNYIDLNLGTDNNKFITNVLTAAEPDTSYRNANESARPDFEINVPGMGTVDKSEVVNGGVVLMELALRVVNRTKTYPRLVPITNYKVKSSNNTTMIDTVEDEIYIPVGGYGQTMAGRYTYPEENRFADGTFFKQAGSTMNKNGTYMNVVDKDTWEKRPGLYCPKLVYGSFLRADRELPVKLSTKDKELEAYESVIIPLDGVVLGKHSLTFANAENLPKLLGDDTYSLFTSGSTFSCKMIRKNSKVDVKNTTRIASYEELSVKNSEEGTDFSLDYLIKHLDYTRLFAGDTVSDLPKYTRYFDSHSRKLRFTGGSLLRDSARRACDAEGLIYKVNNLGQLTTDPSEAGEWAYAIRRDSNAEVYSLENIFRDFTYARGADKVKSLFSIPFKFENKTFAIDGKSISFSTNPNFISVYTYESLKGVGAEFGSITCVDDGDAQVGKEEVYSIGFNTDLSYEFDAIFSTAFTKYNFAVMRDKNNKVVGTVYFGDYIDSDHVMIFSNV